MTTPEIVVAIDQEILKLQSARALLVGSTTAAKRGPGRPRKATASEPARKRTLSPEARAKIAAAEGPLGQETEVLRLAALPRCE